MSKEYLEKRKSKILMVFLSLGLGILIYLIFRSRELFYYQFVEALSLDNTVDSVRKVAWTKREYIPNWVIYSLPDGLWIFSLGIALLYGRVYYKRFQKVFNFIFLSFFIFEFIQGKFGGHGTALGTFDKNDLLCFTIGYFASSMIGYYHWERNYKKIESLKLEGVYESERKKTLIIVITFTILGFLPALI